MGLREWLFTPAKTTPSLKVEIERKGTVMTFKEFTLKYRGGQKADGTPYLFPADTGLVAAATGLTKEQVTEWLTVWDTIQAAYVRSQNRMPTPAEIVSEYNRAHGIVEPVLPPPVLPIVMRPRDPATTIGTPFGRYQPAALPTGVVCLAQLTVSQFEELMVHILTQHTAGQPVQEDASARKLAAVLEALKA